MLQFMKKINGSVSIFLIIIMFPMLVFSFTIVDLCKIFMAQDVIADATDLAVDSGLTSYDKVLKDMYGLMATSASADDLTKKMEDYYNATLELSGIQLTEEEKRTVNGFLTGLLGTGVDVEKLADNQNYLNVRAEKGENGGVITADPVAASAISNPAVMKRQIVEYSKYRGVVSLATGMLEKLGVLSDTNNQSKATKSKIEYEKAVSNIGNSAQDIYTQLRIYCQNTNILEDTSVTSMNTPSKFRSFDLIYKDIDDMKKKEEELVAKYFLQQYSTTVALELSDNFLDRIFDETGIKESAGSLLDKKLRKEFKKEYKKNNKVTETMYAGNIPAAKVQGIFDAAKNGLEAGASLMTMAAPFYKNSTTIYDIDSNTKDIPSEASELNLQLALLKSDEDNQLAEMYDFRQRSGANEKDSFFNDYLSLLLYLPMMDKKLSSSDKSMLDYDITVEYTDLRKPRIYSTKGFVEAYKGYVSCMEKADELIKAAEKKAEKKNEDLPQEIKDLKETVDDLKESDAQKLVDSEDEVKLQIEMLCLTGKAQVNSCMTEIIGEYYQLYQQYAVLSKLTGKNGITSLIEKFVTALEKAKSYNETISNIETESVKNSMQSQCDAETQTLMEMLGDEYKDLTTDQAKEALQAEANKLVDELNSKSAAYKTLLDGLDGYVLKGVDVFRKIKDVKTTFFSNDPKTPKAAVSGIVDITEYIYTADDVMKGCINDFKRSDFTALINYVKTGLNNEKNSVLSTNGVQNWHDGVDDKILKNRFYEQIAKIAQPGNSGKKDTKAKDEVKKLGETQTSENGDTIPAKADKSTLDTTKTEEKPAENDKEEDNEEETEEDTTPKADFFELIENVKSFDEYYAELLNTTSQNNGDSDSNKLTTSKSLNGNGSDDEVADGAIANLTAIGEMLANLAEAARDDLLMTEYATEMFSCHTTNLKDGKLITKDSQKEKMMTGELYPELTTAYRAELEYILYGLDSNEANVAAASAIIFAIRFVLNLIYSFTDHDIRTFTYAAASAAGAAIPFAIPLIQTVIHVGLAIAEAGIDLSELLKGNSVPIFKSKDTWVCSPRGLAKKAEQAVLDIGTAMIDKATDELLKDIDDLANWTDEQIDNGSKEISDFINEQAEKIKSTIDSSIKQPLMEKIQQLISTAKSKSSQAKETLKSDLEESLNEILEKVEANLELDKMESDDLIKRAEKFVVDKIRSTNMIQDIAAKTVDNLDQLVSSSLNSTSTDQAWDTISENLQNNLNDLVFKKLNNVIDDAVDSAEGIKDDLAKKSKDVIKDISKQLKDGTLEGSEAVKEALHNEIGTAFSSEKSSVSLKKNGGTTKSSALSNALNMSYKDYLFVFTLIGFIAPSESSMLSRMAHVMEVNCDQSEGGSGSYTLNKAVTLLGAKTSGSVKTLFFGAVFNDGQLDMSGKPDRYTFTHSSYMGY